ncbi:ribosomal RNA methyltransferase, putative, partial [Ichthyophthirius multifiliis]
MHQVEGATFYKGDMQDLQVLSDTAPNFSGDLENDHLKTMELDYLVIQMASKFLKNGGFLLMKGFYGSMEKQYYDMFKIFFKDFQRIKPKASRSRSSELYYLGKGFGQSDNLINLNDNKI